MEPKKTPFSVAISLVLHAICWVGVTALLIVAAPRMEKLFADFDADLPILTRWFIQAGRFASNYWYLFFTLVLAALAGDYFILHAAHRRSPAMATAWSLGVTVLLVFVIAAGAISFVLPLTSLIENLD